MKEDFLHYIWQFQYFDKKSLQTSEGDELSVMHVGYHNLHAGPDFSQARLRIGTMAWIGQVEIHITASDWYRHGHQHDRAYENVILHVVWESDVPVYRQDGSLIPCLSMKSRVLPELKHRYWHLLSQEEKLPCQHQLPKLPSIVKLATIESAMFSRLERRRIEWMELLEQSKGNWEQVAYRQLARYLGGKLNDVPLMAISEKLSWQELQRHRGNLLRIEALLFGIAGLLNEAPIDLYEEALHKEYAWLSKSLPCAPIEFEWKWGKMRQGNFPTIRLAQLASLANARPQLFSGLWQCQTLHDFKSLLQVPIGQYWQSHYHFGKSRKMHSQWGVDNLLINWVVPLLYTYGNIQGDSRWQEKAIALLHELPAEPIQKLSLYKKAGFTLQQAGDTQGALELNEYYCEHRKCLSCTIGMKVMAGA